MTYFDRVTGPFKGRVGAKKGQYEIIFWAGSTRVGGQHFVVKEEAIRAKQALQAKILERENNAPREPQSSMDASKMLDFWLLDLWECFKKCKTKEQAEVLRAKAMAMDKAKRAMLLVGGTAEPTIPELREIPQEELEKKLKVVNGGTGS